MLWPDDDMDVEPEAPNIDDAAPQDVPVEPQVSLGWLKPLVIDDEADAFAPLLAPEDPLAALAETLPLRDASVSDDSLASSTLAETEESNKEPDDPWPGIEEDDAPGFVMPVVDVVCEEPEA